MKKVSTYEAKAHLSRLIAEVERTGKPVTICRSNRPVVDIVPHRGVRDPLEQAPHLQGARFHGDPCAPVSLEDWPETAR
jgi:prevent-host-death family protein